MTERHAPDFRTVVLPFAIFTAIWGSTWIVIRDQLGIVPPQWSVTYRFIIATAAMANGWAGIVAFGAIRDTANIDAMNFGVKALGTIARRAESEVGGETGVALAVAGLTIRPGDWIYADADSVVVSPKRLA